MRVSDFIAKQLQLLGCKDVFMVTGGASMHLNDSFGRTFKNNVHTLHHEQSCAIAAEGYARLTGNPAIVNVTAGPGGINALNGVFGAYVDSMPMIVISGQAKKETMLQTYNINGLRQLGDQEANISALVSTICKKVVVLTDPLKVNETIDELFEICMKDRQGPVWLDVPIDVQAFPLPDEYVLKINRSDPDQRISNIRKRNNKASSKQIDNLVTMLWNSKRPVLYVGSGIRSADCYDEFLSFVEEWKIPTVTGWNSNDLLWDDHEVYAGRPGSVGNRAGNFAVQYADCVVVLGCRLNIRQISYNWNSFAKNAKIAHIDIDEAELNKPTLKTHLKICSDLKGFFKELDSRMLAESRKKLSKASFNAKHLEWRAFNRKYLKIYNSTKEALPMKEGIVNPYRLIDSLSKKLQQGSITVCADGTACVVGFQASQIKKGQRLFHNSGCASMGYELPAAIGAYYATKQEIICIAGDGSIMMNLQEMAYIGGLNLPIKILLLNNKGYHSIRQTQQNYFPDNPVGCGIESGLPFPNFSILTEGFGLRYERLESEITMDSILSKFLAHDGPMLLEALIDLEQQFAPKLASKKLESGKMITAELEDMSPLLGDEKINEIREEAFNIN